jgi:hypothetical protein
MPYLPIIITSFLSSLIEMASRNAQAREANSGGAITGSLSWSEFGKAEATSKMAPVAQLL